MKDGKLVRNTKRLDVSTRLRQRASKRLPVARPIEQVDDAAIYRCPDTPDLFAGDRMLGASRMMSLEADAMDVESAEQTLAEYRSFHAKEKARRGEAGY